MLGTGHHQDGAIHGDLRLLQQLDGFGFVVVPFDQLLGGGVTLALIGVVDRRFARPEREAHVAVAALEHPYQRAGEVLLGEALGFFPLVGGLHDDVRDGLHPRGNGLGALLVDVVVLHVDLGR